MKQNGNWNYKFQIKWKKGMELNGKWNKVEIISFKLKGKCTWNKMENKTTWKLEQNGKLCSKLNKMENETKLKLKQNWNICIEQKRKWNKMEIGTKLIFF